MQNIDNRIDILNFDREELAAELNTRMNLEPFRAKQLVQWLYRHRTTSFAAMSNIAKSVREKLESTYKIRRLRCLSVNESSDGARKFLFELADNALVETVLIHQQARNTLCISTQVGCQMGCSFCRTAEMGLTRNLETSEILGQVLAVQDLFDEMSDKDPENAEFYNFTNIVFMGMGEPLDNVENVIRSVSLLNDDLGFEFSRRKITISTCGHLPGLAKLAEQKIRFNLAVSLNATTDEVRSSLMPVNRRWPISELLGALKNYPLENRQRITFEYVLIKDINDSRADLERLPRLLAGIPSKINIIPYNSVSKQSFQEPEREKLIEWQDYLETKHLKATVRWSKGLDIDAACGQLAVRHIESRSV